MARTCLLAFIVAISLASAPSAWAYSEVATTGANPNISPSACASCHLVILPQTQGTEEARQGPHVGYPTTSNACQSCHMVHGAPVDGYKLMAGPTVTDSCELCHDGTGGNGVYGVMEARGLTVGSAHRTETTSAIPGGIESGGTSAGSLTGLNGTLTCGDCHQPHSAGLVAPFTTDRMRVQITPDTSGFFSNQLLRRKTSASTTETPVYGSDWCGGCHKGRASGSHGTINHPVDTSATAGPGSFYYERLQVVDGVDSTRTVFGSLGRSNFGYVMPWPRTSGQNGHSPICQQCHEDARSVGDVASGQIAGSEVFTITSADGTTTTDNPRFQTFPHESQAANLLIEGQDDLCSNCHPAGQLP